MAREAIADSAYPVDRGTRCSASRKSGRACNNWAIKGGNVCRMHGGGAPQVKRAAELRLLAASDRMAALLIRCAEDKRVPYAVRLQAVKEVLDRAGIGGRSGITVEGNALFMGDLEAVVKEYGNPTPPAPTDDDITDAEVVEEPELAAPGLAAGEGASGGSGPVAGGSDELSPADVAAEEGLTERDVTRMKRRGGTVDPEPPAYNADGSHRVRRPVRRPPNAARVRRGGTS